LAIIGYARVSTEEQHLDLQIDALEEAGCSQIYKDQGVSAVAKRRKGFEQAVEVLNDGDVFVVWKLDRAFRSLHHALDVLEIFEKRNIQFRSLTDQIDTTTPMGKCMYQIRGVFAELERSLISERTKAGMAAAKKRGVTLGRPRKLTDTEVEWARTELERTDPKHTQTSLAKSLNVSPKTLSRALKE
jgi:DNA invertase Pin-like site-specific DNA recombinase